MNSPFVIQAAEKMASQLMNDYNSTQDRVKWAFVQAYGRTPTEEEFKSSVAFFKQFKPLESQGDESNLKSERDRRNPNTRSPRGRSRPNARGMGNRNSNQRPNSRPGEARRGNMAGGQRGGPPGMANNPRRGRGGQVEGPSISIESLSPEHQFLTLFCQSLIASAEFRILD